MTNNKTLPHLYFPHHLVISIFEYLPVRSLIRFRCVSKTFSSLIHESSFLSSHLIKHSNSNISKYPKTVLYHFTAGPDCFSRLTLYSDTTLSPCVAYDIPSDIRFGSVVGFSNGVVCLFDCSSNTFHFWNPLFNKSVNQKIEPDVSSSVCFGFGYDPKNNRFKLVQVFEDKASNQVSAKLYTTSGTVNGKANINNTWGIYNITPPDGFRQSDYACSLVYVNGAMHWLGSSWVNGRRRSHILSFNVEDEVFGELNLPEPVRQRYDNSVEALRKIKIAEFKGMLCLFPRWFDMPCVWVMKEYGKAESWVPLVTIPGSRITGFHEVVFFKDDAEEEFWVFQNFGSCKLCMFNQRTCKVEKHMTIRECDGFFRGSFVESFALVDVDDEECKCPLTTLPKKLHPCILLFLVGLNLFLFTIFHYKVYSVSI